MWHYAPLFAIPAIVAAVALGGYGLVEWMDR